MAGYVVIRSEFIATAEEARDYYRARLAGAHNVVSAGRPVTVVFEHDATHLYSSEIKDPASQLERVTRRIGPGKVDVREFNLARAQLMDKVLPAITGYTVCVPAAGGPAGAEKSLLYGRALPGVGYMRVVLRPGPRDALTCVSAYPVDEVEWMKARRLKRARFPP
jgi:hypothetical protein